MSSNDEITKEIINHNKNIMKNLSANIAEVNKKHFKLKLESKLTV